MSTLLLASPAALLLGKDAMSLNKYLAKLLYIYLTGAIATLSKIWKQLSCLLVKKLMWYIFAMQFYLTIKKNKIISIVGNEYFVLLFSVLLTAALLYVAMFVEINRCYLYFISFVNKKVVVYFHLNTSPLFLTEISFC